MKRIDWFDVLTITSMLGGILMLVAYLFGLIRLPEY